MGEWLFGNEDAYRAATQKENWLREWWLLHNRTPLLNTPIRNIFRNPPTTHPTKFP